LSGIVWRAYRTEPDPRGNIFRRVGDQCQEQNSPCPDQDKPDNFVPCVMLSRLPHNCPQFSSNFGAFNAEPR
jgi:hypothetical protein